MKTDLHTFLCLEKISNNHNDTALNNHYGPKEIEGRYKNIDLKLFLKTTTVKV